jgi:CRP/FNR family transcriptional regulator, cyclic AMP receptor protein
VTRSTGTRWSESTRPAHGVQLDDDDFRAVMAESFLRDLPEREQQALLLSARPVALPAGKLIYDPQISIIVEGTLRAFVDDGAGRHLTVSYMRRPQSLGVAIAAGQEFPVAFQAVTASRVVRLRLTQLEELRHETPQVGWRAAEEVAALLDCALAETVRVAFQPVRARVAYHLLALAECDPDGRPVHQAELAAAVGSVREVVSRAISSLSAAGLVDVGVKGITITSSDGLRQLLRRGD